MKKRNWIYIPAIIIILALAWYFHTIIAYILVAGVISLIGEPIIRFLVNLEVKGKKLPRALAATLTIGGLLSFFGGIISLFIPMVADEARKLSNVSVEETLANIQGPTQTVQDYINQFKLTDQPIVIENIKSACGCTVPKKPEQPIMPGEKGEIKVSYDTKRPGGFSKAITIFSNAKSARKLLKIKGYVENVKTSPEKEKSMLSNS